MGLELDTTEAEEKATIRDQYRLARFIQEAMLTMLAFVDVIAAAPADARTSGEEVLVSNGVPLLPYAKLRALLGVRGALSKALTEIRLSFHSPLSAEVESIVDAIVSLLSVKESKPGEAIWSTMVQHTRSRTHTLEMGTLRISGHSQGHPVRDKQHQVPAVQLLVTGRSCL
jgi:hypothetical protein